MTPSQEMCTALALCPVLYISYDFPCIIGSVMEMWSFHHA